MTGVALTTTTAATSAAAAAAQHGMGPRGPLGMPTQPAAAPTVATALGLLASPGRPPFARDDVDSAQGDWRRILTGITHPASLASRLTHWNAAVRLGAVRDLAQVNPVSVAVSALQDALADQDWNVMMTAITTLGTLGGAAASAISALQLYADDWDLNLSRAAQVALDRIRSGG